MPERGGPILRILIDACLTPAAVDHLGAMFGGRVDATHVDRVRPPATPDHHVLSWAIRESRLLVTANGTDFVALVRAGPGHAGLGLVDGQNTRARQIAGIERLVRALLDHIDGGGAVSDHAFVVRRTGRLAVRKFGIRFPGDIPRAGG